MYLKVTPVEWRRGNLVNFSLTGRGLEQEFRDRLTALRSESAQENAVLLQQVEHERAKLKEEVEVLRAHDASLHEEVCNATQVPGPIEMPHEVFTMRKAC
jgi:hypothetical protein